MLIVFIGRVLYYVLYFYFVILKTIFLIIKRTILYLKKQAVSLFASYKERKNTWMRTYKDHKAKTAKKVEAPVVTAVATEKTLKPTKSHTRKLGHYIYLAFLPLIILFRGIRAIIRWEFRVRPFSLGFITLAIIAVFGLTALVLYLSVQDDLPSIDSLSYLSPKQTTNIYDRKGNLLYRTFNDEDRYYVTLDEVPKVVQEATIAIEDASYYDHLGISFKGIVRAAKKSYLEDDLQGGSTITQQLVKNTLLSNERTYTRKLKEAILSLELERRYTKSEILEMYLNKISYGGTSYGIKSAAKKYFGKELEELTLAEAALLAGLPASPSNYSPLINDAGIAKARQREVLDLMVKNTYITPQEADEAFAQILEYKISQESMIAPHFVNYVIGELEKKYGQKMVEEGGLTVYTTIDLDLQNKLQEIVTKDVAQMSRRTGVTNGAAMITHPSSGEVLAMVGSVNYWNEQNDGQVNVATSLRQPGSSIKPITYALAFESGMHPFDMIDDAPVSYKIEGQPNYSPENYDGRYHGKLTLKTALANSYNVPAVKVLDKLGMESFLNFAEKVGIESFEDRSRFGLSITLGGGEVRMTDMATAYSMFPNMGYRVDVNPILRVSDFYGNPIYNNDCAKLSADEETVMQIRSISRRESKTPISGFNTCVPEKVISESTAFYINDILSDNAARLPAFGAGNNLAIKDRQVAVKTGTTQNLKDNWAIGYTKDYVVLSWIGNNDGTPMRNVASGYGSASQIWRETFDHLIKTKEVANNFSMPSDMVEVSVCPLTNTLACSACPNVKRLFKKGSEPTKACSNDFVREILDRQREDRDEEDED